MFYPLLFLTLEFIYISDYPFNRVEAIQEFSGGFFTKARNAWYVVNTVAHEAEDVDDLFNPFDAPVFTDFLYPHNFNTIALTGRFVHEDVFRNQLAVVFIWGNHVHSVTFGFGLFGQSSNNVIRFVALYHNNGDVHAPHNFFNPGDGNTDVLRLFFAVGFIWLVHMMPKSRAMWIKGYGNMGRFFVAHQIPQLIYKTVDGGGVDSFGVDKRAGDEGEMCAVDQRMSV